MNSFARTLLGVFAIIPAVSLSADSEFQENVPVEFAEGLLIGPDFGQPTFYSDIVDSFPKIELPEQFELLGSADLVYVTRVILRSALNPAEARRALADSLPGSGLNVVPSNGDIRDSVGFVSLDAPIYPINFCHDSFGNVLARFRGSNSGSLIALDHSLAGEFTGLNCVEHIEKRTEEVARLEAHRNSGLKSYQPRLLLPQPRSDQTMSYGTGIRSSGSDDFHESTTVLVTDWSLAQAYDHFADQINAQGWDSRTENTIGSTIVGEWLNSEDEDLSLIGTLTVQRTGDSRYKLVFRLDRNLYIPNIDTLNNSPFRIPASN